MSETETHNHKNNLPVSRADRVSISLLGVVSLNQEAINTRLGTDNMAMPALSANVDAGEMFTPMFCRLFE